MNPTVAKSFSPDNGRKSMKAFFSTVAVQIGEGTHTVIMEKNRMQLFQAVQQFLDEKMQVGQ